MKSPLLLNLSWRPFYKIYKHGDPLKLGLGSLLTMILNSSILLLRFLNIRNVHHFQTVSVNSSSLSFSLVLVSHSLLRPLLLSRYPIPYKGIPALLFLAFMTLQMILFQSLATIL